MEIICMNHDGFLKAFPNDCHILTYAEEGFAPLNIYAEKRYGAPKETLVAFADAVNSRNEVGSLYPKVPLSAIPRTLVRDNCSVETISKALEDFYAANATKIKAKCVAIDLCTPRLSKIARDAIRHSLCSVHTSMIEKLIILGD